MSQVIAGIAYGSKLAGTTVVAFLSSADNTITLYQSAKKQDADQFIKEKVATYKPSLIMLDAPLSLPGVYRSLPNYNDYFYRQGDRLLNAMSPMFLGGLTARAMKLIQELHPIGVKETYPAQQATRLQLRPLGYKKEKRAIEDVLKAMLVHFPYKVTDAINNWHKVDALLALLAAYRYQQQQCDFYGDELEGGIYV